MYEIKNLEGTIILQINCTSLVSADLRGANLRSANLRSADLRSADLRSADLSKANLRSADLTNIKIYKSQLATIHECLNFEICEPENKTTKVSKMKFISN